MSVTVDFARALTASNLLPLASCIFAASVLACGRPFEMPEGCP
jgi:hypothetical protein